MNAVPETESKPPQSTPGKVVAIVVLLIIALPSLYILAVGIMGGELSKQYAKRASCLATMKQLGTAFELYSADHDGMMPTGNTSPNAFYEAGLGWAGRILPYRVRRHHDDSTIFSCPNDELGRPGAVLPTGMVSVPYAMNSNLIGPKTKLDTGTSNTVLLFEVEGAMAQVGDPNEGRSSSACLPMSAVGSGVTGDLYGSCGGGVALRYETGNLDNSGSTGATEAFGSRPTRHMDKSNYLMTDLHAKTMSPHMISAGKSAHSSTSDQSRTGCGATPTASGRLPWPCAAGSQNKVHSLTFSPV